MPYVHANRLPDYRPDPPEPKVVGECFQCGKEIYEGEFHYRDLINDELICEDHLTEYALNILSIEEVWD